MILYHGSNVEVREPRLFQNDRRADFGTGFYLTSSYDQAGRLAQTVARRLKQGFPLVSVFEFDERRVSDLDVLTFSGASIEWLSFVGRCRRGEDTSEHDIVVGPVADDRTMPTLRLFFAGVYTEEEAIKRLWPQKLQDQHAFRTQRSIDALTYREARCV